VAKWKKIIASGSDAHLKNITSSEAISASGHLFASLSYSDVRKSEYPFVAYNTESGQFYWTDTSANLGGTLGDGNSVTQNFYDLDIFNADLSNLNVDVINTTTLNTETISVGTPPPGYTPPPGGIITTGPITITSILTGSTVELYDEFESIKVLRRGPDINLNNALELSADQYEFTSGSSASLVDGNLGTSIIVDQNTLGTTGIYNPQGPYPNYGIPVGGLSEPAITTFIQTESFYVNINFTDPVLLEEIHIHFAPPVDGLDYNEDPLILEGDNVSNIYSDGTEPIYYYGSEYIDPNNYSLGAQILTSLTISPPPGYPNPATNDLGVLVDDADSIANLGFPENPVFSSDLILNAEGAIILFFNPFSSLSFDPTAQGYNSNNPDFNIVYDFGEGNETIVYKYFIKFYKDYAPAEAATLFEGSLDGVSYVTLDAFGGPDDALGTGLSYLNSGIATNIVPFDPYTSVNSQYTRDEEDFQNTFAFRYYRFRFLNHTPSGLYNFKFWEATLDQDNSLNPKHISVYTNNQGNQFTMFPGSFVTTSAILENDTNTALSLNTFNSNNGNQLTQNVKIEFSGSHHSDNFVGISEIQPITRSFTTCSYTYTCAGSASYAVSASNALTSSYLPGFSEFDGNRPVRQELFLHNDGDDVNSIYNTNFGTSGSLLNFIEAVFFPNTKPFIVDNQYFEVQESDTEIKLPEGGGYFQVDGNDDDVIDGDIFQDLIWGIKPSNPYFEIDRNNGRITIKPSAGPADLSWNNTSNHGGINGLNSTERVNLINVTLSDKVGGFITKPVFAKVLPNQAPQFKRFNDSVISTNVYSASALLESVDQTSGQLNQSKYSIKYDDLNNDIVTITYPSPSEIGTNPEGDDIFSCSVDTSTKTINVHQVTSSLDFDTNSTFDFTITATDEHGISSILNYHIPITNNPPPTSISPQTFTINENKCIDPSLTIGTLSANDEDDLIFIVTDFTLTSVKLGGSIVSDDKLNTTTPSSGKDFFIPHKNPFSITSGGVISLKNHAVLNSDVANQYNYEISITDTFNLNPSGDAYEKTTITITINIEDDPSPTINVTGDGNGHIIESALNNAFIQNTSTHTNQSLNYLTHTTNVPCDISINSDPSFIYPVNAGGITTYYRLNQNLSGSIHHADSTPNFIEIGITASKQEFPTSVSFLDKKIIIYDNQAPTLTANLTSDTELTNRHVHLANSNRVIASLTYSDPEGDDINPQSIVKATNITNQGAVSASYAGDNIIEILASDQIPVGTYIVTLKVSDEHGFNESSFANISNIVIEPRENPTINPTSPTGTIKESAGIDVDTGTTITTSFPTDPGSPSISNFTIKNTDGLENIFSIDKDTTSTSNDIVTNTFRIKTISSLRGSEFDSKYSPVTLTTELTDDYGYKFVGPDISIIIEQNAAPIIAEDTSYNNIHFSESDVLNENDLKNPGTRNLKQFTLTDPEGDTIPSDGFSLTGNTNTSLFAASSVTSGTARLTTKNKTIPAGTYPITCSAKDEFDFRRFTLKTTLTVASAPTPTFTYNGDTNNSDQFEFHVIDTANKNDQILTNKDFTNGVPDGEHSSIILTFNSAFGEAEIDNVATTRGDLISSTHIPSTNRIIFNINQANIPANNYPFTLQVNDQYGITTHTHDCVLKVFANSTPTVTFNSQLVDTFNTEGQITKDTVIFSGTVTDTEHDRPYTLTLQGTDASKYTLTGDGGNNTSFTIKASNNIIDDSYGDGVSHVIEILATDSKGKLKSYTKTITYNSYAPQTFVYGFDYNSTFAVTPSKAKINFYKLGLNFGAVAHNYNFNDDNASQTFQENPIEVDTTQVAAGSIMANLILGNIGNTTISNHTGGTGATGGSSNTGTTTSDDTNRFNLFKLSTSGQNITDLLDTAIAGGDNAGTGLSAFSNINISTIRGGARKVIIFPSSSLLANKPHGMACHSGTTPNSNNRYKLALDASGTQTIDTTRILYFQTSQYIYGYNRWGMIITMTVGATNTPIYLLDDNVNV
jgi:hypothetical protein